MTPIDPADARLVGFILLLLVPLLVADGVIEARGGFTGAFWASERGAKLEHIAEYPRHWAWIGTGLILMIVAATAGLSAFSVLLGQAGEGIPAAVALGSFLLGAFGFVAGIFLQFGPSEIAARVRRDTGTTPGWLDPMWTAASWAETTYIILASLAYVAWGVGMVKSGLPSAWAGWASMAIGGLSVIGVMIAPSRLGFPQLPLLVPIVLGVALVIA
ncbi:MAG TPA: hypothetical protein VMQ46_04445 [Acidimicrobiia bacterium]|nr:hypothetical protein [Acidimicrobiia bacterium]